MSRFYIEAYRPDDSQILGNLDGQSCMKVKDFRRTLAYKRLLTKPPKRPYYTRVGYWLVCDEAGRAYCRINNRFEENFLGT